MNIIKKKHYSTFQIPIVNIHVNVFTQKKEKQALKQITKALGCDASGISAARAFVCTCSGQVIVWLGKTTTDCTLAHEGYHAFRRVMDLICADGEDEELNAYLIGYIHEQLLEILNAA